MVSAMGTTITRPRRKFLMSQFMIVRRSLFVVVRCLYLRRTTNDQRRTSPHDSPQIHHEQQHPKAAASRRTPRLSQQIVDCGDRPGPPLLPIAGDRDVARADLLQGLTEERVHLLAAMAAVALRVGHPRRVDVHE